MCVRIIINADDLGFSVAVNDAIFGLVAKRLVTSATILANAPGTADALARLSEFPSCSFGAHLNVMSFAPLTEAAAFNGLLSDDGDFEGTFDRDPLPHTVRTAIREEWCAQVAFLLDRGVAVSHLDSHYHIHTRPRLFFAFKSVQKRFGIRRARLTKNLYSAAVPPTSTTLAVKKKLWNLALARYFATTTTDRFTEFGTFMEVAREVPWSDQTVELMTHPGSALCAKETMMLEAFQPGELPFEARLISYDEL